MDRHPGGRYRDVLRRQDRLWPGNRDRLPADDVGRARHRVRQDRVRDGPDRRHGRPGRVGRIRRDSGGRLADAPRGGRSPTGPARHGVDEVWPGGRSVDRRRWRHHGEERSVEKDHLRRTDRRQAVQRHADRPKCRRDHRHRKSEGRAGSQNGGAVAETLRHSRQSRWIVGVGRGRQPAGHGARPQREAAGGRREVARRRRVVGTRHPRIHQSGDERQLRRSRVRA